MKMAHEHDFQIFAFHARGQIYIDTSRSWRSVWPATRSGLLLLLVFLLTRDLSNSKCLTRSDNQEVNCSGLAVGCELSSSIGFKQSVRNKTSSGSDFAISFTRVAKVQLVRLTRSVLLASLLLHCNDISVNPRPFTKITCPRCLKTVRRNQAVGIYVLCKARFHLKCLVANFKFGSTCHFCSVPSFAEQQSDDSPNDSFVVLATSDAILKLRGLASHFLEEIDWRGKEAV